MQTLKDDIRQRILAIAREAFIAHGVRGTSIRQVAGKAGIAVGNIYTYFSSKDELFCEVLRPLLHALNRYIQSHNDEQNLSINIFTGQEFQEEHIMSIKTLVQKFRAELRLLLFQAEGTSLAGYKTKIIQHQAEIAQEYLLLMKARYPHINTNISPFLLHIACSTWMNLFSELVEHDEYSEQEIDCALRQYAAYSTAGWKALMNP